MKRIKLLAACVLGGLLLTGCKPSTRWCEMRECVTTDERVAVSDLESRLLNRVPLVLAGHDQDWDDAIKAAHKAAMETCVPLRLFERSYPGTFMEDWSDGTWTGRWRLVAIQQVTK